MKKRILLLLVPVLLASQVSLSSCGKSTLTNSPLIISEYYGGTDFADKAIELYNTTDSEVDLSEYTLKYQRSQLSSIAVTLSGKVSAKSTFVISSANPSDALAAKVDLQSAKIQSDGSTSFTLYKGETIMDTFGVPGTMASFKEMDMIRKYNYLRGNSAYDEYEWLRYGVDDPQYLGDVTNTVTEEELLAGPKLSADQIGSLDQYWKLGADGLSKVGTGNAIEVTLKSLIDGDTTKFNYPDGTIDALGAKSDSVRYLGVNTPETVLANSPIEEFGIPAKLFTNHTLSDAETAGTKLYLQSELNCSVSETYGRILAYVFVGDTCLNFLLMKNGYSVQYGDGASLTNTYKGLTYQGYFRNIELWSQKHKLGLNGAKDPYWDYKNGVSTWTGVEK